MSFIEAIVDAGAPPGPFEPRAAKTYQDTFAGIDRSQLVVVTGEEDNEFQPRLPPPNVLPPFALRGLPAEP